MRWRTGGRSEHEPSKLQLRGLALDAVHVARHDLDTRLDSGQVGGIHSTIDQPLPFVEKQRAKNARDKRPQLGQHFGDVLRRTEARIDDRQPRISRYAVDDVPRHQPRKVGRLANRAD